MHDVYPCVLFHHIEFDHRIYNHILNPNTETDTWVATMSLKRFHMYEDTLFFFEAMSYKQAQLSVDSR